MQHELNLTLFPVTIILVGSRTLKTKRLVSVSQNVAKLHSLAGQTCLVDGSQAGGQLHDDRPDGGLRQQRAAVRSLYVALMTEREKMIIF